MKDNLLDGEYLINTDWYIKTGGYARDMTLRDHFAGLAMQCITPIRHDNSDIGTIYECIAHDAYLFADAMLKERAK
jgi:hypothetical protein